MGDDTPLRLSVGRPLPGVIVVTVSGEIDFATSPTLAVAVSEAALEEPRHVVLDLGGVTFFSCAGVEALLSARGHGPALHLTGVRGNRPVELVLTLTRTAAQFALHPDVDAALAAIADG